MAAAILRTEPGVRGGRDLKIETRGKNLKASILNRGNKEEKGNSSHKERKEGGCIGRAT